MDEISLKQIFSDIWRDKPIFFTLIIGLGIIAAILIRNSENALKMATSPNSTAQPAAGATYVEDFFNNTYTQPPVTQPPVIHPPIPIDPGPKPIAPSSRTVMVTMWPTQDSSLWGIAAHYLGNGHQWPDIYNLNKSIIGPDPNRIKAGMLLSLP